MMSDIHAVVMHSSLAPSWVLFQWMVGGGWHAVCHLPPSIDLHHTH